SNQTTDYVSLNGSLVAKRASAIGKNQWTTTYEHTDALRSPRYETSATGTLTRAELYTPYGEPGDGKYVQAPGYTGHVTDAATHLTYAQQRYYDPVRGGFLSVDPVPTDPNTGANFNRYWYASDNPYRFRDPDGRYRCGDKASCDAGQMITDGLTKAQQAFSPKSKAYAKLAGEMKAFGTQNDGNNVTVKANNNPNDLSAAARGSGDPKTGMITLTINLQSIKQEGLSPAEGQATVVAAGMHELKHGQDDLKAGHLPRNPSEEFWHEVRGVRAETPVWQGLGVDDPDGTWTHSSGLNMNAVYGEAQRSTDSWCPNGVCGGGP
ncbi:MAG: RHS repeat-associated core domain-containing protein, partial [Proteobacteria bacterium]|nr:RHS repeat-associated core domain-containing protein [Pseudomonadota bacterium]